METNFQVTWLSVLLVALITAVITGTGALPFLYRGKIRKSSLGYANAVAAGLMLAASYRLISEGMNYGFLRTVLGFIIGLALIYLVNRRLSDNHNISIGKLQGINALKALLIIGVMTAHSFAEGIGVGVSFSDGKEFGIFVATAIAVHNIPEGLAIAIVLIPRGISVWKAALWAVFSSIPQPLLAVPAFLFVETFQSWLPVGLGLAGGAMIWMVVSELLPDALGDAKKENVAVVLAVSIIAMILFQNLIEV